MSLLNIITGTYSGGAAVLSGLPNPTSVIGSTDPNVPTLLRLANQEGEELSRRHDWQALLIDYTTTTLGAELQTALPSDFDHFLPNVEIWNRSTNQKYAGPTNARTWGQLKAASIAGGSPGWWRLVGNLLYIYPSPTAGQTIAFPYQSTKWCQSSGGTAQTYFQADTDTAKIPERLITLGIIWRWNQTKGFDYSENMSTYEREVERACSRDRGLTVIRPGSRESSDPITEQRWTGTVS